MFSQDLATIKQGDILASHWGYDAHLTEFYLVKKRTPKMVELVELKDHHVDAHGMAGWDVAPIEPYQEIGKTIKRKVKTKQHYVDDEVGRVDVEYVALEDWKSAVKWNGKPVRNFDWH